MTTDMISFDCPKILLVDKNLCKQREIVIMQILIEKGKKYSPYKLV